MRLIGGSPTAHPIAQPRRLALLTLIADANEAGVTRDRVLGLLWPDVPQAKARHSLDQLLYALRQDLGPDVLTSSSSLALNRSAVGCDVWEFEAAVRAEDWPTAAEVYGGSFLDGFFAGAGEDFDQWADARRAELHGQWLRALEHVARIADAAGDRDAALRSWTRLAGADPLNSRYALSLMKALAAGGDSVGALRHASIHEALVQEEIGAPADRAIHEFAEALRADAAAHATVSRAAPRARLTEPEAAVVLPRADEPRTKRARYAVVAAVLLIAAATAGRFGVGNGVTPAGTEPPIRSLAVLPFRDFSPSEQYLADGLTDELINQLGKVPGLDVVARTSVFTLKGKDVAVGEIGRQLGVAHVLEGSVQRAGERLRISARLVATRSGYQLWAENYDASATDLFDVKSRIARAISGALQVTLTSGGSGPPTRNGEAYDLYLRGRNIYLTVADEASMRRALEYLTRASELDPAFAAAHAGLADLYGRLNDYPRARAAALQALRLDSTLAEAHFALSYILAYNDRNWRGGLREIDRAIQLNSGYAPAYLRRSNIRAALGEFDGAGADVARAMQLDPLSNPARMNQALVYFWGGRYTDAVPIFESLIANGSNDGGMRMALGLSYLGLGRTADATRVFREMGADRPAVLASGDRRRVDSLRVVLEAEVRSDVAPAGAKHSPYIALAFAYAQLGMDAQAIATLQQLFALPLPANTAFIIWWPSLRQLHSHPDFARVRRVLFPG